MTRVWLAPLCAWLLAACGGGAPARQASEGPADATARTFVYDCSGLRVTARTGPGELALWLPDRYVVLPQVGAASGARYENAGVLFWSKGEGGLLEIDRQVYPDCRLLADEIPWEDARRRGVDLRALGEAPGWTLEVQRDRHALFVEAGGMHRAIFFAPQIEGAGGALRIAAGEGAKTLLVAATPGDCRLAGQSAPLPLLVRVTLGERQYAGCGRLLDHPWE